LKELNPTGFNDAAKAEPERITAEKGEGEAGAGETGV
jgi:hypothetical protein